MATEKKIETNVKKNNYTWVEVIKNVKLGNKVFTIGEKVQLPPSHVNILVKNGCVKKK